ncbi:MAG: hypothetical protein H6739_16650 [Alphaproteobacteria bacterium]|nr:hypothetical protein [Alphaproteobacteria bacterium]
MSLADDPSHLPDETADTAGEGEVTPPCDLVDGRLSLAPEGAYVRQGSALDGTRGRCEAVMHATAGARSSTLDITLSRWGADSPARVEVRDLLGQPMLTMELSEGETTSVGLERSGEVLVVLEPLDPDADANDYTLDVTCAANCELAWTRYPIVLMHGMGGTDAFLDLIEYYQQVVGTLTDEGYLVFNPAVDALAPPPDRAAQWAEHLDALIAAGEGRKFNLIAHSQGGIDGRYLISDGGLGYHDRVVSLTTIATPHQGTTAADAAAGLLDLSEVGQWIADGLADVFTQLVGLGDAQLTVSIERLTTAEMAAFNASVPDDPDVYYASWAGRTCGALDFTCQQETDGEIVDALFVATYALIHVLEGDNDGLVGVESAQWGDYRGVLPADHLNEVGWFSNDWTSPFDHLAFFSAEAAHLAERGY